MNQYCDHRDLHFFPTRRSSDLVKVELVDPDDGGFNRIGQLMRYFKVRKCVIDANRSEEHTSELHHTVISYAVFFLKKKKKNHAVE